MYKITVLGTLLVLCSVFLFGCTTAKGPAFTPITQIPDDKALIYIYKPKAYGMSMWKVKVNGEVITVLRRGGYYPYLATPGSYLISAEMLPRFGNLIVAHIEPERTVTLTALAGNTYYIKSHSGINPRLAIVTAKVGKRELKKCVLLPKRTSADEDAIIPGLLHN